MGHFEFLGVGRIFFNQNVKSNFKFLDGGSNVDNWNQNYLTLSSKIQIILGKELF